MITINAPLKGRAVPLAELSDPAFASGMLGIGLGILPEEGKVYAPANGTVKIFPTKHAITMVTDDGVKLIIHIGINTVNMEGKGFKPKVKDGDTVKTGQLLMDFDIKKITKAGYSTETPIIITNHKEYGGVEMTTAENVTPSDMLFTITKNKGDDFS
ncbi:MAG: PTS glucose transporter subunit IIA [Defluviitaleaceae bacterium]|nr:PTS glucose transporter subunit IIA [Defluviitaleaceae bacterium]